MRDRLRPPRDFDTMLNQLREDGLFETRQKAMMFAAALGFRIDPKGELKPLDGYGEGIPYSVFTRAVDDSFLDALAVTRCHDLHVLREKEGDRRLEIFEHYAQLGLSHIQAACYTQGRDPLLGLLDLIDRYSAPAAGDEPLPGLQNSIRELSRLL